MILNIDIIFHYHFAHLYCTYKFSPLCLNLLTYKSFENSTVLYLVRSSKYGSVRHSDLPLLPQSAQDSSSSGRLSRFDSFVPRQKLHIGMGSTRSWVGTQTETNCLKTETSTGCVWSAQKPVCFQTFYPVRVSESTAGILLVKAGQ